jgi:hypothetical protein
MKTNSAIGSVGRLRFIEASKATLTVATPVAHHKIVHVSFSRDGVFVQFPYFLQKHGIVSRVEFQSGEGALKFKLDEYGKAASHLVKLSHHTSGRAHFSQDGKVKTEIIRQSFRLDTSIGPIFQVFAFGLGGFSTFDSTTAKRDRTYIQFASLDSALKSVTVQGEWRRKSAMESNIRGSESVGPEAFVTHRQTRVTSRVYFLSPPSPHPLDSHVLMLACSETTPPSGNGSQPMVILVGGWDPGEVREGEPSLPQTGCLACLYPVSSPEEMSRKIGTIDFRPSSNPLT